ncbi:hypothetical protein AMD27_16945 (plasmid) [Acinetobacter sp. TGL-Y2]|uniref:hypothetical protein n=1 Tax=Acinetobacter sp. TGL-Y2 TaxID=1407071 RepID=UPI0007A659E6|nr:hypothetical protein [Acinetobacter sp. TGL-Y2]AMW80604.1 hypothetical protein AMD27_16945 [Acinetobacter sp. TGL-Y2]
MYVNLNKRFKKPLSSEDARHLLKIRPRGTEIFFNGNFFIFNSKKTSYLAWSATLQKWIIWLHEKPNLDESIGISELFDIASRA